MKMQKKVRKTAPTKEASGLRGQPVMPVKAFRPPFMSKRK